jgi:hypothetical protein
MASASRRLGREREAGSDFPSHRRRDEDLTEERLKQPELVDLLKRDEGAGVRDDDDHKDSREAISAARGFSISIFTLPMALAFRVILLLLGGRVWSFPSQTPTRLPSPTDLPTSGP